METLSALLALCAGNSPVTGEFPAQRPVTRSFDVSFDLRLNKRSSKQSWGWGFETPSCPLWRHYNDLRESTRTKQNANFSKIDPHSGWISKGEIVYKNVIWIIRICFEYLRIILARFRCIASRMQIKRSCKIVRPLRMRFKNSQSIKCSAIVVELLLECH